MDAAKGARQPVLRQGREETSGPRVRPPSRRLRLRVCLRRRTLDRRLATGLVRMNDPAMALRAKQLCSSHERRAIAEGLQTILDAADERRADAGSHLILDHAAVLSKHGAIVVLIEHLRSYAVCDVRGIALARLLTLESSSPLFRASDRTLAQALAEIFEAF